MSVLVYDLTNQLKLRYHAFKHTLKYVV